MSGTVSLGNCGYGYLKFRGNLQISDHGLDSPMLWPPVFCPLLSLAANSAGAIGNVQEKK